MKHLPKHLRPRYRYLAVGIEAFPDATVGRSAFRRALGRAAGALLGDPGRADADLRLLGFTFAGGTGEAVVRTRHTEVGQARAALACIEAIDGQPVRVRVRGISGTVRACEEKYMGGPTKHRDENRVVFRNADRQAVQRGDLVDVSIDPEADAGRGFAGATRLDLE